MYRDNILDIEQKNRKRIRQRCRQIKYINRIEYIKAHNSKLI